MVIIKFISYNHFPYAPTISEITGKLYDDHGVFFVKNTLEHRLYGPADIYKTGEKYYFLNGKQIGEVNFSNKDFKKYLNKMFLTK